MVSSLKISALLSLALVAIAAPAAACEQPDPTDCPAVSFRTVYKGEAWRNLQGGIESGGAYLDNLDLVADLDAEKAWGVKGLTLHGHVIYNNGHPFGARYVGELQPLSNIEGVSTWRLYEIWTDYSFGSKVSSSVRFGLYDFNTEFNALESSALFLNSSHGIGPDVSQSGLNGPSIFPVPGLALRIKGQTEHFYWQVAALDAVPGEPDHPDRTGFRLSKDEGALLAVELGGEIAGFSKLALGAWRYSAEFDSVDEVDGNGDPVRAKGNQGVYLLAERPLWSLGASNVAGFLRTGIAENRFNQLGSFIGAGVTMRGLGNTRPDDDIGIALASARNSGRYRRLMQLNGSNVDSAETVLELTWRAPVADWLTLQPSLQYVLNPGTDPSLANDWSVGLRFEFARSWPAHNSN